MGIQRIKKSAKADQPGSEDLESRFDLLKIELSILLEITALMAGVNDSTPVFDMILRKAIELTKADSGSLMIVDQDELQIVSQQGLPTGATGSKLRVGEGIAGWVAEYGRPLLLGGKGALRGNNIQRAIRDAISVPLLAGTKAIGVLNVSNTTPERQLTQDDVDLLIMFASQAALAVRMLRSREQSEEAYLSVIRSLAEAIDAKDPYTAGHSRRVGDYARQLCFLLNTDEDVRRHIQLAAMLHDIGKIGVPEEILRKPQALDAGEVGLIKTHPVISAKILEPIESLAPAITMIRHHHECYDGSGYPAGLKGENIPFGARILAIVDAFDAMVSGRPHRRVISVEQVISDLQGASSIQFDPRLLKVFIKGLQSGNISLEAAVFSGQELKSAPMSSTEVSSFLNSRGPKVIAILRDVNQRILEELESLAGRHLAEKYSQVLALAAAESNLDPLLPTGHGLRRGRRAESVFGDFSGYFSIVRDQLATIVGARLAERILIETVRQQPDQESRFLLTVLRDIGIEPPL